MSRCRASIWEVSLEFFLIPLETIMFSWQVVISSSSWRDQFGATKHVTTYAVYPCPCPSSIRRQQSMRGPFITSMLIYCCGRANILPLAVVKSTIPVSSPSVPCDGTLTYPDSTFPWRQIHRSLAPLWKHDTSLWHLYRPSVRFDFGSSNTHGVYTRWNKVGILCPRPWLENPGHSGSHGWGLVSRPCYEYRLQGMADGWVMSQDNGLLFWVSVEHRNILYVQSSQSGNHGTPKEGNERGPPSTQSLAESGRNAYTKSRWESERRRR